MQSLAEMQIAWERQKPSSIAAIIVGVLGSEQAYGLQQRPSAPQGLLQVGSARAQKH